MERLKGEKRIKAWNMAGLAVMATFAGLLLGLAYPNYLRKVAALTMFLPTGSFFDECMQTPGGFLAWVGALCTQTFAMPWLGACVFAVIIIFMQWVASKALAVQSQMRSMMVVLPAMALLSLVQLGYVIFTLKPQGYAYMLPIGIIVSCGIFWLYRLWHPWWLRMAVGMIAVEGGYHYFGFYALFGAAMCCLYELTEFLLTVRNGHKTAWVRLLPFFVTAAGIAIIPRLWFVLKGGMLWESRIFVSGLPLFATGEADLWVAYLIIFAILLLLAGWTAAHLCIKPSKGLRIASVSVFALSIAAVCIFRCSDSNLMLTLDMDQDLWNGNPRAAVQRYQKFKDEPTRLNSVLALIVLNKTGEAPSRLFTLPYGDADYGKHRAQTAMHDAGMTTIAYHLGCINLAYRWVMEYKVEQGLTPEYLKYMAKSALLNQEWALAFKHLTMLATMPGQKQWATKYMAYLQKPELMLQDAEFASILPYMNTKDHFVNDAGRLEGYFWAYLSKVDEGSAQMLDLSLLAAMLRRDLGVVMWKLPLSAQAHNGELPVHFQEAALLASHLLDVPLPSGITIDKAVSGRFDVFIKAYDASKGFGQDQIKSTLQPFADTYYYYHLCCNDIKLN